jgi:hypothetical protein
MRRALSVRALSVREGTLNAMSLSELKRPPQCVGFWNKVVARGNKGLVRRALAEIFCIDDDCYIFLGTYWTPNVPHDLIQSRGTHGESHTHTPTQKVMLPSIW